MTQGAQDRDGEGGRARADRLQAAVAIARAALESQRSDKLPLLFEYLLSKTLSGAAPSESEIASQAFVNGGTRGGTRDANVRVYVHRLRKLIDTAFSERAGPRLEIPVGEYRVHLVDEEASGGPGSRTVAARVQAILRRHLAGGLIVGAALAACAVAGYWYLSDESPLARTLLWRQLDADTRPLTVVVGDYYLFAEVEDGASTPPAAPRLIWDRTVPTREDLTVYHILNPATTDTILDFNQQFASSGTIVALSDVRSALAQVGVLGGRRVRLVASSQLVPETLMTSDIVYVGLLSGMNVLLRDPLMQASGFRLDNERYGLVNAASGRTYRSEGMNLTDERIPRRDFGYLAAVPGPAGNTILVVSGLGDAGLKEAAQLAKDPARLEALGADSAKRERGFEALFRVRTIKSVNVGATLVINRPLRSQGIWDRSAAVPAYRPVDPVPPPGEER